MSTADKKEDSFEQSGSKLQIPTSSVFQQQIQQTQMNGQQPNGPPPFGGQNPPPFGGQNPPPFGGQNPPPFGGQQPPSFGGQQPFGIQQPPPFGSLPTPQQSFPNQPPLLNPPAVQPQSSGLPQLMAAKPRKNDFPEGSNSPTANLPNAYGPSEFSD